MRITDDLLGTVAFFGHVEASNASNVSGYAPQGTGFFVCIPAASMPGRWFHYLVTAKHVLDALDPNCLVRINRTGGGYVDFDAAGAKWYFHPQHGPGNYVDVAVMWLPSLSGFDVTYVHERMILAKRSRLQDEYHIGLGDETFTIGLFASAHGQHRSMPIVRHGTIAMLPEDRIWAGKKYGFIEAYLSEIRSFSGISGSPVFARRTLSLPGIEPTVNVNGPWSLLGLMHGHWHIDENDVNAAQIRSPRNAPGVNLGISIVIPAYQIMETLNHPELVKARADQEQKEMARLPAPVADSLGGPRARQP